MTTPLEIAYRLWYTNHAKRGEKMRKLSSYTIKEYETYMKQVMEKHEVTRPLADILSSYKNKNPKHIKIDFNVFAVMDEFLTTLEKYGLDTIPNIKDNIRRVVRGVNFQKFYEMLDFLQSDTVAIEPKQFFNRASVFLMDFDLTATKEVLKTLKRMGYDYKTMFLKCKELTVNPNLPLLKGYKKIMRMNAKFENPQTPRAIAENTPSIFVKGDIRELPKILQALTNSTYEYVRKNKYSHKEEVVQEKLFQPLDRVLLSNGDLLSMEDASEIEKLNGFLKENGLSVLEIFSVNTSIYRRAKYDLYAPAYELAIRLRSGDDEKRYQEVKEEINQIIVKNPAWLVSITEDSVRKGYQQSNELCEWNEKLADIYHMANPKVSTKSYSCDMQKLLEVFEYVYQDADIAKEKILSDPRVKQIHNATTFEKNFKLLESNEKFIGNRDELVELVDANLNKMTKRYLPYLLDPENAILKDKGREPKKSTKIKIDETNVKIYHLTTKAKTTTLELDGNNLTKKSRNLLYQLLLRTSEGDEQKFIESIISYIASSKKLVEQVNHVATTKKIDVKDIAKYLQAKKRILKQKEEVSIEDVDNLENIDTNFDDHEQ